MLQHHPGSDAAVAPDPAVLDVAGCIAAPDKVDGESIHCFRVTPARQKPPWKKMTTGERGQRLRAHGRRLVARNGRRTCGHRSWTRARRQLGELRNEGATTHETASVFIQRDTVIHNRARRKASETVSGGDSVGDPYPNR